MTDKPASDNPFKTGQIHVSLLKREPKVRVPEFVKREHELTYGYTKNLTASVFGDPLPWRSALGKGVKK